MKNKWYLSSVVISIMFALWIFLIPPIIGIILLILKYRQNKQNIALFNSKEEELNRMIEFNKSIGLERYEDVTDKIEEMKKSFEGEKKQLETEIARKKSEIIESNSIIHDNNSRIEKLNDEIQKLEKSVAAKEKQLDSRIRRLNQTKELLSSINYSMRNFLDCDLKEKEQIIPENTLSQIKQLTASVSLKFHSMDVKELRKAYKKNDEEIDHVLEMYSDRYKTKANIAIYNLMVIALRSELQNILYNLKYEKLDDCINQVKTVTSKYLKIAGDGNQSIINTLTKFIGQIEYLFMNAVKIEYNYYVKKEQAKQEQKALREKMRQEAAERKALEAEKKKIEKEEIKYQLEIKKLEEQLKTSLDEETTLLKSRILELEAQLSDVTLKKEEISNLAQGKAGNVYIISNIGSFGENIFKIGMTRRLNPQDRVDELGSASVPFKFDVHSFIFSNDAVSLEKKLHEILNDKRVNKVNMRKEFFETSIDELEEIVNNIDPTAEFRRTILAEEYRQSLSEAEIHNSSLLTNTIESAS